MYLFQSMTRKIIVVLSVLADVAICQVLFRKEVGHYLSNSLIQAIHANNEYECGLFCSKEPLCVSANFKLYGADRGRCELNRKLLGQDPREYCTKNTHYIYLELLKKVSTSKQCKNKPNTINSAPVGLYSSVILKGLDGLVNQLTTWLNGETNWNLCYRASQHGWSGSSFHTQCDNKGPTVTIVQVGNYRFGGYSDISWEGSADDKYKVSVNCFLFSLEGNKEAPFKSSIISARASIYNNIYYGPTFGGGHDLHIKLDASDTSRSYSNLGNTYQLPPGYTYNTDQSKSLLAGSYYFTPTEVEVFYLNQ